MTAAWVAAELVPAADRDAASGAPIRLAAARCAACGRCSFPATGTCTWCGAPRSDPVLLSSGTAVAATAVLHRTPGSVVEVPYVVVLARFARNRRLASARDRWAFCALSSSPRTRRYYDQLRSRGKTHSQAIRQVANRLVGVLHVCLERRVLYDEEVAWGSDTDIAA